MNNVDSILASLKSTMGKTGKIRCMLHSIAKGNLKPMQSENDNILKNDDFLITIDAMATSLYSWTAAVVAAKLFATDSRVLSFTSEGSQRAIPHYAAVSAAKASLEAITRSMALEFAPLGIRSNCIQAGVTDTPSLKAISGANKLLALSKKRNPFQRNTTPRDVADVVYLLCTDEASWINGSVVYADGGEHIC